ncbi:MAG TPA: rhodanese-like domain-containing protein [Epsilonproteobacteria bacterium]|nr:rhodanese-like domain-containing protein [Campylobacterota bacterium]
MFHKIIIIYFIFITAIIARTGFEYEGIPIKVLNDKGKIENIIVKRDIPEVCRKLPINNNMVWTGNYANPKVPDACKSTYVHTTGKLLPMQLDEEIETYGELEILAFMKEMQKDPDMLLIDGRKQEWFDYRTIPGAVNMPFHHFKEREAFEFEFEHDLLHLGVIIDDNDEYDFKKAKTIAVFCNGPWCSQSVAMISALLEIGYPVEKIKWYRGGMQDWLAAGMTSTRK